MTLKRGVPARHALAVYWRTWFAQIRSIVEYPADLWVMASAGAVWNILQFAFLAVLFANVPDVAGWGYHEMLMLSGLLSVAGGCNALFWDGAWSTGSMVIKGDIDYRITRPAPVMMQIGASAIGMQAATKATTSALMVIVGWTGAGICAAMLPAALLLFACAVIIQLTVTTSLCCVSFWMRGPSVPFAFLGAQVQENATRLPLHVYPGAVRAALTWVVPFAFVNYVPVSILTGGLPSWWIAIPPLMAAALAGLTIVVARAGLAKYESAGN